MSTATAKPYGITHTGADSDGHGGYARGISGHSGIFTALTGAKSASFKTLRGAEAFMARFGFDAYGRRL